MKRPVLLLGLIAMTACLDVSTAPNAPSDPGTETFASNLGVNLAQMTKTADGVYYKDITVGTGTTLTSPALILASYIAFLKDGSSIISGDHQNVTLSTSILGLQEGTLGMKEGGERLIVIPSALGFGNSPNSFGVPPNATLVFDIIFYQIE